MNMKHVISEKRSTKKKNKRNELNEKQIKDLKESLQTKTMTKESLTSENLRIKSVGTENTARESLEKQDDLDKALLRIKILQGYQLSEIFNSVR